MSLWAAIRLFGGHTVAGLRANPRRAVTALAGYAAAVAVITAGWNAESLDDGGWLTGALLLGVIVGATAAATDTRQLRAAAVLDLSGATRQQRRAVVLLEALLLAAAALPIGAAAGLAVATATGTRAPSLGGVAALALLVPAVVTLRAGRVRTRVTAVDARGVDRLPAPLSLDRASTALRLLAGIVLVWTGYWIASSSDDFFDLELLLWPGIVLTSIGLALLLPFLLAAAAWLLDRTPWLTANLDGALLRSRRTLLAPALLLGTVAAFSVAVQGVLGAGLYEREQRRQHYLDRFTFTAGLHPNDVVVGSSPTFLLGGALLSPSDTDPADADPAAAERVRTELPGATVTELELLPRTVVRGDPLIPADNRTVAVATPEVLAALDLERYAPDLAAGRGVALDPTVVRRGHAEVKVFDLWNDRVATMTRSVDVAAVVADLPSIPLRLPALLVPPDHGIEIEPDPDLGSPTPLRCLVVRLPHRATREDAGQIAALVDSDMAAWPGAEPQRDPYESGQLDAAESVGLRRPGEVGVATTLVGLVALLGVFVTLRLAAVTRRSDEEVVETLGGSQALLRRLAVLQAAILAALATSLGLAAGIGLTAMGVAGYNHGGRFDGDATLPPIPLVVPSALWIGLAVVPLVAAALAWLLALRRPAPTPSSLADGLLW